MIGRDCGPKPGCSCSCWIRVDSRSRAYSRRRRRSGRVRRGRRATAVGWAELEGTTVYWHATGAGEVNMLNYSSLILCYHFRYAVTIRVGHSLGELQPKQAKVAVICGLLVGLSITVMTASSTILLRTWIVTQYTDDPTVITLAAHLIIFTLFINFQTPSSRISAHYAA